VNSADRQSEFQPPGGMVSALVVVPGEAELCALCPRAIDFDSTSTSAS
jgi:hypothetical protein